MRRISLVSGLEWPPIQSIFDTDLLNLGKRPVRVKNDFFKEDFEVQYRRNNLWPVSLG